MTLALASASASYCWAMGFWQRSGRGVGRRRRGRRGEESLHLDVDDGSQWIFSSGTSVGATCRPCCAPLPLCPVSLAWGGAGAISRRTLIALAQLIIRHFDSQGWGTSAWDGNGIDAVRYPWRRRKASGFSKKQESAFCRPRPGAEGTPGHDHDPFDAASPSDNRALERELNVTGNTRRGAILTIIGDWMGGAKCRAIMESWTTALEVPALAPHRPALINDHRGEQLCGASLP